MASRKKAAAGKKSSGKGKAKVEKVMHEFKHHELRSGGGRKVTNPKQAIAIALSEAREAGADIPEKPRRGGAKKTSAKKKSTGTARKSTAKKAAKKSGAKKTTSRKRTAAKR